jgi:rare lipoprotein A (peptidoglycan hydrolase)
VIDDRGPFVYAGRIIDLSYNAAKELGIQNRKPSMVRVEVLVEDSLMLSRYIATHCKGHRDPAGRSWCQLYFQEIKKCQIPGSLLQTNSTKLRKPYGSGKKQLYKQIQHL